MLKEKANLSSDEKPKATEVKKIAKQEAFLKKIAKEEV